jgi:hypothetical protein
MLLCGECYENVYTFYAYKLFIIQGVERWLVCKPLSVSVFVTLASQFHLEYRCKAFFETLCTIVLFLLRCYIASAVGTVSWHWINYVQRIIQTAIVHGTDHYEQRRTNCIGWYEIWNFAALKVLIVRFSYRETGWYPERVTQLHRHRAV